jgi:hypothetical protein
MDLRKADFITGIFLILLGAGVLVLVAGFRWDLPTVRSAGWYTAPGLVPAAVAGLLTLQGLRLAVFAWRNGGRPEREDLQRIRSRLAKPEVTRGALVAGLLSVYVFGLIGRVPFVPATLGFLTAFMLLFRAGYWWKVIPIAVAVTFAISSLFERVARIPLP